MGNDSSRLKGLVIDKNAVEANDFWALYNAVSPTTSNEEGRQLLSIFQGETVVSGQLWVTQTPLERAIKNLMIYRHPYILKYVTTWEQGGQKHLATERVRPLIAVMSTQSDIQVCLGLRTILCSLIFLVEKALARHLNICSTSIYITDTGSWRLAGFEYVWKHKEVTKTLMELVKSYRYKPAVDPCESELKEHNTDFIEQYAFATLCEDILSKSERKDSIIPHVQEFRAYCAEHLKHKNTQMRPKLSAVLLHPYFNHEFVLIHSFLFELPLKSVQERQDFFTGLIDRLRYFNEDVVGAQLGADLLSRMVLLDPTAQLCVTPYVLKTKTEHSAALFSNATYSRHLMPHIRKMFRLRDAQIRLILLEYFMEFVRLLTKTELEEFILPHLIEGMNDTNDILVAKTLRCLADLVPILGAGVVLGGQRTRIFSDGRPQAAVSDTTPNWVGPRSITPVLGGASDYMVSGSPLLPDMEDISGSLNSLSQAETSERSEMPPRLSPDGGEDDKSAVITDGLNEAEMAADTVVETIMDTVTFTPPIIIEPKESLNTEQAFEDDEPWSDWETDELQRLHNKSNQSPYSELDLTITNSPDNADALPPKSDPDFLSFKPLSSGSSASTNNTADSFHTAQSSTSSTKAPTKIIDDLDALDIQVQTLSLASARAQQTEFDFFKDMEPVIEKQGPHTIKNILQLREEEEEILIDTSRFAAVHTSEVDADECADAGNGWGSDNDEDVAAINWSA